MADGAYSANLIFIFTLAVFAFFILLESLLPRRQLGQSPLWRWSNNFSLSLVTWYITVLGSAAGVVYLTSVTGEVQSGLMEHYHAGLITAFLSLLVISQFISYLMHMAFHKIPWLWPIHAVHHTDVDVDVSTSYRHHPLEPLVSLPLMIPVVLWLGVPLKVAICYKLFEVVITVFSHSNVRLPTGLDRVLRPFILTPDFHRLHHCAEARFTNSNYGSVVPWFDYLFGTASGRPYEEQATMRLGLEYLRQPRDGRLDRLIIVPFQWARSVHSRRS